MNAPDLTDPERATLNWVDDTLDFREHQARLEHTVRDADISPALYRRLTGW